VDCRFPWSAHDIIERVGPEFREYFFVPAYQAEIMTSEMVACLSSVAQITCAVQSLLGALLLFLLGLALRSRFRMR
jgi:hypothetical protein